MRILGIPVTPPLYHLWSMTLPQIELMCADHAVTIYPKTDKCVGGRGGKGEIEFPRLSKSSIEVARQRWEQMKRDKAEDRDRGFKKGEWA